jgi:hypothetical protein
MSQKAVEIILTRQLASYVAMPIFVVDPGHDDLFLDRLMAQERRSSEILFELVPGTEGASFHLD